MILCFHLYSGLKNGKVTRKVEGEEIFFRRIDEKELLYLPWISAWAELLFKAHGKTINDIRR
ncbi:MAG: hypothetical protein AABY87_11695 [bacterium]